MKREHILSAFFIGLFIFILYQLFLIFSPFINAIFWAGVLAFAFHPLNQQIARLPKINRSVASVITTVFVVLIVVIPAALILLSLIREAIDVYQALSSRITVDQFTRWIENIRQTAAAKWPPEIAKYLDYAEKNVSSLLVNGVQKTGNFVAIKFASITKGFIFGIINFFLIGFVLFFFLRDGQYIYEALYRLIPMENTHKKLLSDKLNEAFAAIIRGQFVTSILQGIMATIAFWALSLPAPFLVGSLTFLTSMVPITGAATVWVPFAIYLFVIQAYTKFGLLLVFGIFGISLMDNILKPLLIGEKTKLPILLLFLGSLGGLRMYGFTGIFLGPLILSVFFVLLKIYREQFFPTEV
ncbi:MAG: hypothetical protein A3G33_09795 [Omnitrophica bacterium RIFCSPLOWO2_12_FULL_44_17]|uniref:AI-2E family transporter n=1 Tax=Candidatus Danuiimicrobium aquiferis TaxID=1801832 RepID=A0A1G1KXC1_9BACT|nr:MAG: hypothetical protein A3B72_09570 [Omnitrophica bacterium RIFCSPHIGHO2_02_FULL_45_28]OGW89325.1 MAG: hypothetical protein A3E74_08580 [Omnitrophica bacterium RIFCSPHIGHO2_12_FULL_44_12]OGW97472.1 MAG: hypothetical protein A3G33_09795 [Omnitrophica bacterium RIFCSPLOWO2_12_FULL_44_17]OGX04929.1 MAG: hypothetical protein A3J12_06570 [Omnitrophica bacterium RIFCSPLOWO2_02_FULL_44_11]